jgi:hypothetical protein
MHQGPIVRVAVLGPHLCDKRVDTTIAKQDSAEPIVVVNVQNVEIVADVVSHTIKVSVNLKKCKENRSLSTE